MKKLLLLLSVFIISCTQESIVIQPLDQTQEEFVFAGTWLQKSFQSSAWIINQGTGELSNQGSMFFIPITAANYLDWSINDATAEYDWSIENINGQKILTILGGYGQDEIIIENEGDYCNEEWYSLAVIDEWFIRLDESCD